MNIHSELCIVHTHGDILIQYSLVNLVWIQYSLVNIVWDTASTGGYGGYSSPWGARYSCMRGTIFTFTGIYTGFTLTPEATASPIRMKLAVKDSPMKVVAFRYHPCTRLDKCFKKHFVAINSCISGEVGIMFQSKTCTIPLDNHSSTQNWLCFVEY